jgi:hypothetical protein
MKSSTLAAYEFENFCGKAGHLDHSGLPAVKPCRLAKSFGRAAELTPCQGLAAASGGDG